MFQNKIMVLFKPKPVWQFELSGSPPFSFKLTVHKPRYGYWLTPFETYKDEKIWSGMRLFNKTSLGLKLQSIGDLLNPKVLIEVFYREELEKKEKEELRKKVSKLLQIERDISEFYVICEKYPLLKKVKRDLYGFRDTHFSDLFNGILLALTLQMTTWKRSLSMLEYLYLVYGERIKFDGQEIIISPLPNTIERIREGEIREKCKIGYRANYLKSIASTLIRDFPSLDELERLSPLKAKRKLMELKGIGEYSADIVTPHPSFPVDIWSVKVFSKFFGIETGRIKNPINFVKEYANREFGKWQGYVYAYILHDLNKLKDLIGI